MIKEGKDTSTTNSRKPSSLPSSTGVVACTLHTIDFGFQNRLGRVVFGTLRQVHDCPFGPTCALHRVNIFPVLSHVPSTMALSIYEQKHATPRHATFPSLLLDEAPHAPSPPRRVVRVSSQPSLSDVVSGCCQCCFSHQSSVF